MNFSAPSLVKIFVIEILPLAGNISQKVKSKYKKGIDEKLFWVKGNLTKTTYQ
jgi:hypothetical protein